MCISRVWCTEYQVHGHINSIHNLITAPSFQVNALFEFYTQNRMNEIMNKKKKNAPKNKKNKIALIAADSPSTHSDSKSQSQEAMKLPLCSQSSSSSTQRFSHSGTYIRMIGIRVNLDVRLLIVAGAYHSGFSKLIINEDAAVIASLNASVNNNETMNMMEESMATRRIRSFNSATNQSSIILIHLLSCIRDDDGVRIVNQISITQSSLGSSSSSLSSSFSPYFEMTVTNSDSFINLESIALDESHYRHINHNPDVHDGDAADDGCMGIDGILGRSTYETDAVKLTQIDDYIVRHEDGDDVAHRRHHDEHSHAGDEDHDDDDLDDSNDVSGASIFSSHVECIFSSNFPKSLFIE